jgi:hypothetical protein
MAREDNTGSRYNPRPAARGGQYRKGSQQPAVIAHMALVTASERAQKAAANSASPLLAAGSIKSG